MTKSCASCGHTNRGGARFCAGCGAELPSACPSCGAELPAGARFCDTCGAASEQAEAPAASRKVVSIVLADLAGSTEMQESLDPESARRIMGRFYDVMRGAVEAHGGSVQKFIGDAVVAVFGIPAVGEDDALRAVRAASAMVDRLEELNEELEREWGVRLRMRTGVHTGELVLSDEGILVGDAMNTAARLEQAAPAGAVLVGEPTWRLVHREIELEPVEPLELKGKSEPVRAWRLISVAPAASSAAAVEAPLIGRGDELDRLRAALSEATEARECRLVSVIGWPGVGKTRLAHEFGRAVGEQASVVFGHCEQSGEGITFLPVAEVLREIGGIGEADAPELVQAKLAALVPDDDPERARLVEATAGVLGATEPASAEETFWALRRGIENLARMQPIVLVLDDVHWGEPMFLDLIEHLVEWIRDAPVLIVALARPELREVREALAVKGRRALDVIELEPLDEDQSRELVTGLLGQADLPAELNARIVATTEGNPLFLGELLRMLVDEGALRREGETWVAAPGIGEVEVPPTIQALLAARIERLGADERSVVERAAVIGKQFYRGAVAELVTPPVRTGIDDHLEALRRKDMVEPEGTYWIDEPVYRFHHVLIRDAAYRSLLKEARAELHERFAEWLEEKAGELVGEHEEVIAFHLEQAHDYRRQLGPLDDRGLALGAHAATRLHSAGRRALAREDLAAAANLLGRALACDARDEAEILWELGEATLSAGDTTAAAPVVERLRGDGDDAKRAARADVLAAQLANLTGAGEIAATADSVAAATAQLAGLGDSAGEAKGHHVGAQTLARLGRVGAVEAALDGALAAARVAEDRRRVTAVLAGAPRAALWGPSPVVRASGRCLDVVRILRMTPGNRPVEAVALRCQAVLEAMRGRADAAREILAAGRTTLEELGLSLELHETAIHAGIVELLAADPVAAEDYLRAARDGFVSLGVGAAAAQAAALLARALVDQGRDAEALDETRFAEERGGEDLKTSITWCGVRAEALAHGGEHEQALEFAERAVALAEPTDALPDKADASMALARVLLAAGRDAEAEEAADTARALYEKKGHAVGAERAAAMLGAERRTADQVAVADAPEPTFAEARGAEMHLSEPDDQDAILARYAELGGRQGPATGDLPPQRWYAEFRRLWNARDAEGLIDLYADDWVMTDRREIQLWGETRGREAQQALNASAFAVAADGKFEVDEVIACDQRVIALQVTWSGSLPGGGEGKIPVGAVSVVENGRHLSMDIYEPDQRKAIITRFAELGGGLGPLGDSPPERHWAEFARPYAAGDLDAIGALFSEDSWFADHRRLPWENVSGPAEFIDLVRSSFDVYADQWLEVDEVLAADDRLIAVRHTWHGADREGGGKTAISVGVVADVRSNQVVSYDQYEHDDREAMLARFAELGGRREAALGDAPSERLFAEQVRRFNAEDAEGVAALAADDFAYSDHRAVGVGDFQSSEKYLRSLRTIVEGSFAIRVEPEQVLACDDGVIAVQVLYRGTGAIDDGGGDFESVAVEIWAAEDGQFTSLDHFEPEDRQAIIARYAELGGGQSALGDRPPERSLKRYIQAFAARDIDSILGVVAEDWVLVDHRQVGWGELHGHEGQKKLVQGWSNAQDVRPEVDEVLACDDRLIAVRVSWLGTMTDGGGPFSIPLGLVIHPQGMDVYEHEDREAMLARFAELASPPSGAGDLPTERFLAAISRAWASHNLDAIVELFSDDYVLTDHRQIGWEPTSGVEAARERARSALDVSPDISFKIQEVLACDARVVAAVGLFCGSAEDGGPFEVPLACVWVVEEGKASSVDMYDPGDREAILARYEELTGGDAAPGGNATERFLAEFTRRWATHDVDQIMDLFTADYELEDHRGFAWEPMSGPEAQREVAESAFAMSPDVACSVDEVLACDDHVGAMIVAYRGTAADGGGPFEILLGHVVRVENGRASRLDMYDPADRTAMIARYAELGGGQGPLGDRPPERLWANYIRRFATRDLKAMREFFSEESSLIDHRTLGYEEAHGLERAIELFESAAAASPEMRIEIDEVLACDDRVLAMRHRWCGQGVKAGLMEVAMGGLTVVEDGQIKIHEIFEPDDLNAILARYAELSEARPWVIFDQLFNARTLDALPALYTDDFVMVDRRKLNWEDTRGQDGIVRILRDTLDLGPDQISRCEVLADDGGDLALIRNTFTGSEALEQFGEFEFVFDEIFVLCDGRIARLEVFDPEDAAAARARYEELRAEVS